MSAERAAARPRGRRADSGGTSGLSRPAERAGLSSGGAWPGIRPGRGRQNGPGAPAHRGPTPGRSAGRPPTARRHHKMVTEPASATTQPAAGTALASPDGIACHAIRPVRWSGWGQLHACVRQCRLGGRRGSSDNDAGHKTKPLTRQSIRGRQARSHQRRG